MCGVGMQGAALAHKMSTNSFREHLRDSLGATVLKRFRESQHAIDQGKLDCGDKAKLGPHQLVVYRVAQMLASRADDLRQDDPRGLLAWHGTGTGKTLAAVAIVKAFFDQIASGGYKHIYLVTTTSNHAGNDVNTYVDLMLKFFGEELRHTFRENMGSKGLREWIHEKMGGEGGRDKGQFKSKGAWVKRTTYHMLGNQIIPHIRASQAQFRSPPGSNEPTWDRLRKEGVVFVFDEVHNFAKRAMSGQPAEQHIFKFITGQTTVAGTAFAGANQRVLAFVLSATPGKSIDDWLAVLNIVRPAGTARLTPHDASSSPAKFKGLVSFMDMTADTSKFATIRPTNHHAVSMTVRYAAAAIDVYKHPTAPKYDSSNPLAWRMADKEVSNFIALSPSVQAAFFDQSARATLLKAGRIHLVGGKEYFVSEKLVYIANLASDPKTRKQLIYTSSPTTLEVLATMLESKGMQRVPKLMTHLGKNSVVLPDKFFGMHRPAPRFIVLKEGGDHAVNVVEAIFNDRRNLRGEHVRVVLTTGPFYEGLDLHGLQYVHAVEPLPNKLIATQLRGRASRHCGHVHLAKPERVVRVIQYYSVFPKALSADVVRNNFKLSPAQLRRWNDTLLTIQTDALVKRLDPKDYGWDTIYAKLALGNDARYREVMAFENMLRKVAIDGLLFHQRFHSHYNVALGGQAGLLDEAVQKRLRHGPRPMTINGGVNLNAPGGSPNALNQGSTHSMKPTPFPTHGITSTNRSNNKNYNKNYNKNGNNKKLHDALVHAAQTLGRIEHQGQGMGHTLAQQHEELKKGIMDALATINTRDDMEIEFLRQKEQLQGAVATMQLQHKNELLRLRANYEAAIKQRNLDLQEHHQTLMQEMKKAHESTTTGFVQTTALLNEARAALLAVQQQTALLQQQLQQTTTFERLFAEFFPDIKKALRHLDVKNVNQATSHNTLWGVLSKYVTLPKDAAKLNPARGTRVMADILAHLEFLRLTRGLWRAKNTIPKSWSEAKALVGAAVQQPMNNAHSYGDLFRMLKNGETSVAVNKVQKVANAAKAEALTARQQAQLAAKQAENANAKAKETAQKAANAAKKAQEELREARAQAAAAQKEAKNAIAKAKTLKNTELNQAQAQINAAKSQAERANQKAKNANAKAKQLTSNLVAARAEVQKAQELASATAQLAATAAAEAQKKAEEAATAAAKEAAKAIEEAKQARNNEVRQATEKANTAVKNATKASAAAAVAAAEARAAKLALNQAKQKKSTDQRRPRRRGFSFWNEVINAYTVVKMKRLLPAREEARAVKALMECVRRIAKQNHGNMFNNHPNSLESLNAVAGIVADVLGVQLRLVDPRFKMTYTFGKNSKNRPSLHIVLKSHPEHGTYFKALNVTHEARIDRASKMESIEPIMACRNRVETLRRTKEEGKERETRRRTEEQKNATTSRPVAFSSRGIQKRVATRNIAKRLANRMGITNNETPNNQFVNSVLRKYENLSQSSAPNTLNDRNKKLLWMQHGLDNYAKILGREGMSERTMNVALPVLYSRLGMDQAGAVGLEQLKKRVGLRQNLRQYVHERKGAKEPDKMTFAQLVKQVAPSKFLGNNDTLARLPTDRIESWLRAALLVRNKGMKRRNPPTSIAPWQPMAKRLKQINRMHVDQEPRNSNKTNGKSNAALPNMNVTNMEETNGMPMSMEEKKAELKAYGITGAHLDISIQAAYNDLERARTIFANLPNRIRLKLPVKNSLTNERDVGYLSPEILGAIRSFLKMHRYHILRTTSPRELVLMFMHHPPTALPQDVQQLTKDLDRYVHKSVYHAKTYEDMRQMLPKLQTMDPRVFTRGKLSEQQFTRLIGTTVQDPYRRHAHILRGIRNGSGYLKMSNAALANAFLDMKGIPPDKRKPSPNSKMTPFQHLLTTENFGRHYKNLGLPAHNFHETDRLNSSAIQAHMMKILDAHNAIQNKRG
jgi:hypothetical protein